MTIIVFIFLLTGLASGFVAGLLGVGGGIIIVANHNGHDYSVGNYLLDQDNEGFEKTGISRKRNFFVDWRCME